MLMTLWVSLCVREGDEVRSERGASAADSCIETNDQCSYVTMI